MLDAPIVQRVDLDQRRAGEPPRKQRLQGRQGRVSSTITRITETRRLPIFQNQIDRSRPVSREAQNSSTPRCSRCYLSVGGARRR